MTTADWIFGVCTFAIGYGLRPATAWWARIATQIAEGQYQHTDDPGARRMRKPHCDNCDALIVDANPKRLVTVQPWGFQCVVGVTIRKTEDQELCVECLHAAVLAFAESLRLKQGDTREHAE